MHKVKAVALQGAVGHSRGLGGGDAQGLGFIKAHIVDAQGVMELKLDRQRILADGIGAVGGHICLLDGAAVFADPDLHILRCARGPEQMVAAGPPAAAHKLDGLAGGGYAGVIDVVFGR